MKTTLYSFLHKDEDYLHDFGKTSSQQGPLNNCYKAFKVNSKLNVTTCSAPSSYDSCRCSTFIFIHALKPAHTDRPSYFNLANLLANMNSYKHPANRTALNLVQCPPNEYNSCIDSVSFLSPEGNICLLNSPLCSH